MKNEYIKPRFKMIFATPPELNQRHSQRVALRVAVLIRANSNGESLEVEGFTQIVNAHGGLLESPLMANAGQEIILIDTKTSAQVASRVVRVDRSSADLVTMAFEFRKPTVRFWPITCPPEDWKEVTL
jgi:hypothetical protein